MIPTARRLHPVLFSVALLLAGPGSVAAAQDLPAVLAKARAALGLQPGKATPALQLRGRATLFGVEGDWSLVLDSGGRFREELRGTFSRVQAFDGKTCWERDWMDTPAVLALRDREEALATVWLVFGLWAEPGARIEVTAAEPAGNGWRLDVRLASGRLEPRLFLDAEGLPVRVELPQTTGLQVIRLRDHRDAPGMRVPGRIEIRQSSGETDRIEVQSAEAAPAFFRDPFAPVLGPPGGFRFEAGVSAALEVRQAPSGLLLVPARLDGGSERWFILDTGAGASVISSELAEEIGAEELGHVTAQGVGGQVETRFRRAASLRVGPLVMEDPLFVELDLSFLAGPMGVEIGGILGYGVLGRATVMVDVHTPRVELHPSGSWDPPAGRGAWTGLVLAGRHPCVRARFEGGREGIFKIDTGAGRDNLIFHAPAVRAFRLLEGRETRPRASGGVGGFVKTREGELEWFELGGRRFERPRVGFALEDRGAFGDEYTTGNLGGGFLEPFLVVFDYPRRRLALVSRD